MVKIMSEQGYPKQDYLFVRVDYFNGNKPPEGGILVVGKDNRGRQYEPKNGPALRGAYTLPSGTPYPVPVGSDPENDHPALYFPFQLDCKLPLSEVVAKANANEPFFDALDMKVMDSLGEPISLDESLDKFFKFLAISGVLDLADINLQGGVRNHSSNEIYIPKSQDIEQFLEAHRS